MIKVIKVKKLTRGNKKYEITFDKNGKKYTRRFGSRGMSDYTIHKDKERRERYISRHKKDLRTGDPMRAGFLSMYILWNKPSFKASLADYKRRLNVYNRTGKFPKKITGSKKLSFGSKIPDNVLNKKLYSSIKSKIKRSIKGRRWGAYDSGRLVSEYKRRGGKYSGSKRKTDLGRWYKEKWVDACAWPKRKPCGRKTKKKVAYCRPSKRVDSKTPKLVQKLTAAQRRSRCARKKRSPMKRITRFGHRQWLKPGIKPDGTPGTVWRTHDEVFILDPNWVIHCSLVPGVGIHVSIRSLLASRTMGGDEDFSFHYGVKHKDRPDQFWRTGDLAGRFNLPEEWKREMIRYYTMNCGNVEGGPLFPLPSPYRMTGYPPPSPMKEHWSYNTYGKRRRGGFKKSSGFWSSSKKPTKKPFWSSSKKPIAKKPITKKPSVKKFDKKKLNKMRKELLDEILNADDTFENMQASINKRCQGMFQSHCDRIFTELIMNAYYYYKHNLPQTQRRADIVKKIESIIKKDFPDFRPTKIKISPKDNNKIENLLMLLQDNTFGSYSHGYLATLIADFMRKTA